MLFSPKKYGRDWTLFLAIGFYAAAFGFGASAIASIIMADNWSDWTFGFLGFLVAAMVFGALGKDQSHKASEMGTNKDHKP